MTDVEAAEATRADDGAGPHRRRRGPAPAGPARDRSRPMMAWYRLVQNVVGLLGLLVWGLRSSGRGHMPATGGVLLVSNHASHLDVFLLGLQLPRPLNYVARSTLFVPVLASLIRSVGGFPIQRDGLGASGIKETLKRLRAGGIVTLFPEGTRTEDGQIAPIKPGIAALASRARVPIVPTGIAGSFESWPKARPLPRPHPIHVHYGRAIEPAEIERLPPEAVVDLIQARLAESLAVARRYLAHRAGRAGGIDRNPA